MKKIIWICAALIVLAGIAGGIGYYFVLAPNTSVKDDGVIYIREGDSFETVLISLQSKGYVKNEYTLRKVAALKKYPALIKSGRYHISNEMSNNALINMLRAGRQSPVLLTFNNIRTMDDFARAVSGQLAIRPEEIMELSNNSELLQQLEFTKENFIGMFIPNTYQIYWDITAKDFIAKMAGEYRKFWNDERKAKSGRAGLSPMDVTILASIIEEETLRPEEYPVIAGVYINRLNRDMPLGACPTLKFALGDFTLKRILDKHLEVESPYNTYKYKGLPPGPVRMPSINVIDAVLNYQHHDYLFFCAKSDFSGGHHFSRTLRQHNEYARQYHAALNARKIY